MTTKVSTNDMQFIVQFPDTDQLSIGPFPSHDAAQAFGEASVFHAIGARFDVVGVIAPRPDHVAKAKPVASAAAVPQYRKEFPDFDYDLPAIPGMLDHSWHNDTCPHLADISGMVELFCDYADPAKREIAETPRYSLHVDGTVWLTSDELDKAMLGSLREALIQSMMRSHNYARESAAYELDTKGFTADFTA